MNSFNKLSQTNPLPMSSITSYLAGIVTVQTAIAGVRSAWEDVQRDQQESVRALQSSVDADRLLGQVSTREELARRRRDADALSSTTGVPLGEVKAVQFEAISLDIEGKLSDLLESLTNHRFPCSVQIVGQAPRLFKKEVIDPVEGILCNPRCVAAI